MATIGSMFGGIPSTLPAPSLPSFDVAAIQAVLPSAFSFALLGSIESLLSAVVADGMTGRRHRSNCELVGQGVANVASGLFGGFCVTGTIARTATNVRSGAHGPVAGMLHAAFLLAFMALAAPLARYIPLASLAAVLALVAWAMIERHAIATLLTSSRGDAAVLLVTFLLTIFRDLSEAIVVGFALGSVLFIHRMSQTTALETHTPLVADDRADGENGSGPYDEAAASDPDVVIYRITGAFFFGAAAAIGIVLDRIAQTHRAMVIDLEAVPFLDSTAAKTIEGLAHRAHRRGTRIVLTGASGKFVGTSRHTASSRPSSPMRATFRRHLRICAAANARRASAALEILAGVPISTAFPQTESPISPRDGAEFRSFSNSGSAGSPPKAGTESASPSLPSFQDPRM